MELPPVSDAKMAVTPAGKAAAVRTGGRGGVGKIPATPAAAAGGDPMKVPSGVNPEDPDMTFVSPEPVFTGTTPLTLMRHPGDAPLVALPALTFPEESPPPASKPEQPASQVSLVFVILAALAVGTEYGFGTTVMGLSSHLLDSSSWAVVLQVNGAGRVLGALILIAVEGGLRGNWPKPESPGQALLSPLGWACAATSMVHVGLYLAVHFLTTTGEVSILMSMAMLYTVVPVAYGILVAGERFTAPKLAGFTASAAATGLLSAASVSGGESVSSATMALQAGLLVLLIGGWGTTDTVYARLGRKMHIVTAAAWYAMGNGVLALTVGQGVALWRQAVGAEAAAVVPLTPTGGADPLGGYLLILGANLASVAGWYGYVKLGQVADASLFVPIISALMTAIPAVVASSVLGEGWTPFKVAGVAAAVVSAVCMGLPPPKRPLLPCATRKHTPLDPIQPGASPAKLGMVHSHSLGRLHNVHV